MDLEGIVLSEINQTLKHTPRSHLYVESKKRRERALLETEDKLVAGGEGWARRSKRTRRRGEDKGPWGSSEPRVTGRPSLTNTGDCEQ